MTITNYQNFDVLITKSGDQYQAFLVHAPGMTTTGTSCLSRLMKWTRLGGLGLGASPEAWARPMWTRRLDLT